ncbi:hypothetical protein [Streptomyces meridianus]|uniref:Secreted protein n=1 Tax=Streptomyces meridianus TaxID=2938945 RepID=A0ABT0X289_9ACTN|nr:hypothetical protein [Streptomyces meridianus]MCM2576048.1 hypothetical protein [Streptomyces meridianus]
MEAVIAIVAVLFVLFVAVGAWAALKVITVAKAGVDRTVSQARRAVEDTTLRAKRYTTPGAAGELARLRLSLRASMRATQEVLGAGAREDASLAEAVGLFERLSMHGRELDAELGRLEREPDRPALDRQLPELRERVGRVTHSADALRWAAQDRARRFASDELSDLSRRIDLEAGALRHWTHGPEHDGGPLGVATRAAPDGAAGGTAGKASDRASGDAAGGSAANSGHPRPAWEQQSGPPPAVTARDPRQETGMPWRRARRPENTA